MRKHLKLEYPLLYDIIHRAHEVYGISDEKTKFLSSRKKEAVHARVIAARVMRDNIIEGDKPLSYQKIGTVLAMYAGKSKPIDHATIINNIGNIHLKSMTLKDPTSLAYQEKYEQVISVLESDKKKLCDEGQKAIIRITKLMKESTSITRLMSIRKEVEALDRKFR